MLFVFSPDEAGLTYLRVIGGDPVAALEQADALRIVELKDGDHIFSSAASRACLSSSVLQYLVSPPDPKIARRRKVIRSDLAGDDERALSALGESA